MRSTKRPSSFNCLTEIEGLLKVTRSHVHRKTGNILETFKDRDDVTTDYEQEMIYGLLSRSNSDDLE